MTGIGNGRMAKAGSLIRTHLRTDGRIVAEFLALLAVHSGKQQVESGQENGSILGAWESSLLFFILLFIWMISCRFGLIFAEQCHSCGNKEQCHSCGNKEIWWLSLNLNPAP